jgi:hypothetical protein
MNETPLDQETDELLTAYLDGELSPQDSTMLEHRLVEEEGLRLRLAELRKTYDLLDEIQETPYDQRFTRSTLELVVQDITRSTSTAVRAEPRSDKRRLWPWVVGGVCAIALGSGAGALANYARLQSDFGDLALAANVSGFSDAYDYPVLKELAKERKTIELLRRNFSESLITAVPSSLSDRADWVKTLSPLQQAQIESEREQLHSMNRVSLARFEAMQKRVESEPNSEEIQEVTRIIGLLMDQVPHYERLNLEKLSSDNRLQYLREQMSRTAATYYFSHMLTEADTQHLKKWGDEVFLEAITKLYPEFYRGRDESRFVNWAVNRFVRRSDGATSYPFQDLILPPLMEVLSEESNEILKQVRKEYQLEVLAKCLFEDRLVSEGSMMENYEKISKLYREAMDLGDPAIIRQMLRGSRFGSR